MSLYSKIRDNPYYSLQTSTKPERIKKIWGTQANLTNSGPSYPLNIKRGLWTSSLNTQINLQRTWDAMLALYMKYAGIRYSLFLHFFSYISVFTYLEIFLQSFFRALLALLILILNSCSFKTFRGRSRSPLSRQILVSRTSWERPLPTSPKNSIWPSRGSPDLNFRGHPNLRSWGSPEMMSRGCSNLTFKGRP